jgi:hypothetical protein
MNIINLYTIIQMAEVTKTTQIVDEPRTLISVYKEGIKRRPNGFLYKKLAVQHIEYLLNIFASFTVDELKSKEVDLCSHIANLNYIHLLLNTISNFNYAPYILKLLLELEHKYKVIIKEDPNNEWMFH